MDTVICQVRILLAYGVHYASDKAGHVDGFDVGFYKFSERFGNGARSHMQGERLARVHVKEDTDEDDGHGHVELMFGKDAFGMLVCLKRKRENVCGKMDVGEIANAFRC